LAAPIEFEVTEAAMSGAGNGRIPCESAVEIGEQACVSSLTGLQ